MSSNISESAKLLQAAFSMLQGDDKPETSNQTTADVLTGYSCSAEEPGEDRFQ